MMAFAHADEYPVVTDDTRMTYYKPVYFAINLGADDCQRLRIEDRQIPKI